MADITERLRDKTISGQIPAWVGEEAADEIERLRAAIAKYEQDDVRYLRETKRLHAELDESQQARHKAECELVAADANVVRLRAALERIADAPAMSSWHALREIARAALAGAASTGSERRNPYEETADTLRDFLRREGYVRCDSQACNCGSYHGRFGLHERWQDMKDALAEAGHPLTNANGNTPLRALRELIAERDALRAAVPASAPLTPFGEAVALIRDAFGDAQAGKVFGTENALCDETVERLRAFLKQWDGPAVQPGERQ